MKKLRKKTTRTVNMTEGPVLKSIIAFSIPLALMGMLQVFYNAADIIIVGNFAGDSALASVGATSSSINLIVNLFIGLSVGSSVVISHYYGEENWKSVSSSVHTSVTLSLIVGILMLFLGLIISEPLLSLIGTPDDIIVGAVTYMKIYCLGMPASLIFNFVCGILRAVGNTKVPLVISVIAGIINVILNLFFVIVFGLGVVGVALATIISQYFSAIVAVKVIMNDSGPIRFQIKNMKINKKEVIKILKIGIPSGINSSLFSISNTLIQSSVNSFGSVAVAGNSAASSIEGLQYAAMNAFSQASLAFVAQNYGAKKLERFRKVIGACIITTSAVSLIFSLIFVPFGKIILHIYSADNEVLAFAYIKVAILSISYMICGMNETAMGALRGIGRSTTAMIISIFGICGLRVVWIYTVFEIIRTPESLFLSYPVSWLITFAVNLLVFKKFVEKIKKKEITE